MYTDMYVLHVLTVEHRTNFTNLDFTFLDFTFVCAPIEECLF